MPDEFIVRERAESRTVNIGVDATLEFMGYGSSDDEEARDAFEEEIPTVFLGMPLSGTIEVKPVGGMLWYATAKYSARISETYPGLDGSGAPPPPPDVPPPPPVPAIPGPTDRLGQEFSFDITTVTEKITQSKKTISRTRIGHANPGNPEAPDFKGAIGVTEDGEIQGCERLSPKLEWKTTKTVAYMTLGYLYDLYTIVGRTNNASFYGFPMGTNLCIGISGQSKKGNEFSITFSFAVQPNETDIYITGEAGDSSLDILKVPAKKGWEFLWIGYEQKIDPVANKLVLRPYVAVVEKIYDSANFSLLGIGS